METIDIFKNAPDAIQLASGDVVSSRGEPADVMYAVVEGELEVEVNGRIVATIGPGQIVGEMALIDRHEKPRTATVRALTDARVVSVDEDEFLRLVHRTPFFALQILRIVSERLRATNEMI